VSTETEISFSLIRAVLHGQAPDLGTKPIETSAWWSLFRLLQRNHVAAMTADTVATLDISREVLIPWLSEKEKAVGWHRHQQEVQEEIVDVMRKHGIDTLVLKGTHLAHYWPQSETREFGDLDLYFYDKHREADRVAKEVLKVDVTNEAHHHSRYDYHGVTVESHYDFLNIHYPASNRRYEALLKELVGDSAQLSTFEVLFLMRHMAGHFAASRITLRDLVDWALTCHTLEKQVDWTRVQEVILHYGMERFAHALCTISDHRLGITLPLSFDGCTDVLEESYKVERNIIYGDVQDHDADGFGRLAWKLRRWRALSWKREMVYNDSPSSLLLRSLTSHATRPQSILHKM